MIDDPVTPAEQVEHEAASVQESAIELNDSIETIQEALAEHRPVDVTQARRQVQVLRGHLDMLDQALADL